MKLFLTSSCISKNLQEPFLKSFGKNPSTSKCYFIPTATDLDQEKFYTCKSMDDLAQMGFNPIWYTLKYKNKKQLEEELSDADIIWVGGGNTFYLLDISRKIGFLDVISDLIRNKNIAYGGISAGTVILAKNIESAGWEPYGDPNDVKISDFKSLGLIDFVPIVHYEKIEHENIINKYKKSEEKVFGIPNETMIIIDDDKLELIGNIDKYN